MGDIVCNLNAFFGLECFSLFHVKVVCSVWRVPVFYLWRLFGLICASFVSKGFLVCSSLVSEGCLVCSSLVYMKVVWYVPVCFIWRLFGMFQFVLYEVCLVCSSLFYMKVVWYVPVWFIWRLFGINLKLRKLTKWFQFQLVTIPT